MTQTRERPQLRTPETDQLAQAAGDLAIRYSDQFGKEVPAGEEASLVPVPSWVKLGPRWRISFAWLLEHSRSDPKARVNVGFHIDLEGGQTIVETWGRGIRLTWQCKGLPTAEQLGRVLALGFTR